MLAEPRNPSSPPTQLANLPFAKRKGTRSPKDRHKNAGDAPVIPANLIAIPAHHTRHSGESRNPEGRGSRARQVPLKHRGSGGMVDAHALGACGCGRAGSNPASPTTVEGIKNLSDQVQSGTVNLSFSVVTLIRRMHR